MGGGKVIHEGQLKLSSKITCPTYWLQLRSNTNYVHINNPKYCLFNLIILDWGGGGLWWSVSLILNWQLILFSLRYSFPIEIVIKRLVKRRYCSRSSALHTLGCKVMLSFASVALDPHYTVTVSSSTLHAFVLSGFKLQIKFQTVSLKLVYIFKTLKLVSVPGVRGRRPNRVGFDMFVCE